MEMLIVVAIIVALAAMGGYFLFGTLQTSEEEIARMQTLELTKACKTYFLKNRDWPPDLVTLLAPDEKNGGRPYLENQNALMSPWGEYQYDPTGGRNAAKNITGMATQPDIWATTREGKEIGNWPQ
jgi:type II secretory pathway pseudopilin PulG